MSSLIVIPELGLGIFVTTNGVQGGGLAQELRELVLAHYFSRPAGATPVLPKPAADFAARGREYVGRYRTTRRSYGKLEKVLSASDVVHVDVTPDGHVMLSGGREPTRFVEVGKDIFHKIDGDAAIGFARDARGAVTHLVTTAGSAERIGLLETLGWLELAIVAGVLASAGLITGAIRRAWRAGRRRRRQAAATETAPPIADTVWERRGARLAAGAAGLWLTALALLVPWALRMQAAEGAPDALVFGYPQLSLKIGLGFLVAAAAATVVAVAALVPVWRRRSWPLARRLFHTLALVVLLALAATAHSWNLLGWKYF